MTEILLDSNVDSHELYDEDILGQCEDTHSDDDYMLKNNAPKCYPLLIVMTVNPVW